VAAAFGRLQFPPTQSWRVWIMSTRGGLALKEWDSDEAEADAVGDFKTEMLALLDRHRPSRMPFFRRLAALPFAIASDPEFLGEVHLVYQAAMHATRAAVYYLPHLDNPALRKRKLQIFIDDDGLAGGDTHHYQLSRAFRNIGATILLEDEEFGSHEALCQHLHPDTATLAPPTQKLNSR